MLPLLFAMAAPPPVQTPAQPPVKTVAPATQDRQIATIASLGTIIFALDRAAWVATDALKAKLPGDQLSGIGGWVIERGDGNRLIVTFFLGTGGAARAVFAAEVRDGKVAGSRLLAADTLLTPTQQRLARARTVALDEAVARGYRPCTNAPFNTVVMPTTDPQSPVFVYLLSAQITAGAYPIGGHYRVTVAADGRVRGSRPFSKSCITMTKPSRTDGQQAAGFFVTHILDPLPVETHVFSSLASGLPLFVGAGDRVWIVNGRTITMSDVKLPAAPR